MRWGGEIMLKISEFARACNVSTQTLRYYDAEGILSPDVIDPYSGYRYYSPDKIEVFRRIQTYKDAGFALDEIKELLYGDPAQHHTMMARKRHEITNRVQALQTKLSILDTLSRQQERRGGRGIFLSEPPFVDQPEVLGVWELCGRLDAPADGDFPDRTAPLVAFENENRFERLVFLADGVPWWCFCWSHGVLYWLSNLPRALIPNPFVLWETEEGRYMTVRYGITDEYLNGGGSPVWLLYRQIKHAALTEAESHAYEDETDLPILPDGDVLGAWDAVAWTRDPQEFTPSDVPKSRENFWILGMIFSEDNTCLRRIAHGSKAVDLSFPYTRYGQPTARERGAVLHPDQRVAEAYCLRSIHGEEYLFVQHKSGDYIYGGRKPLWYVFRRAVIVP
jgi:DNA-binding transcriptional MerR regulator